jgi:hypothetical protein
LYPPGGSFVPEMGGERALNREGGVPARRERVCNVNVARRSAGLVLGFGKDGSRGRDPSLAPVRLPEKKSCSDSSGIVYHVRHDSKT